MSIIVSEPSRPHEIVTAFDAVGWPLAKTLCSMLNESNEHRRPRRGCGFTQASRFLADIINCPRGLDIEHDLKLFSDRGQRNLKVLIHLATDLLGSEPVSLTQVCRVMEQNLEQMGKTVPDLPERLTALQALARLPYSLDREESRLLVSMILSILGCAPTCPNIDDAPTGVPPDLQDLMAISERLSIGTCSEAERYFLELARGYLRSHGLLNIITDLNGEPLLVEKINIGDSHSCVSIRPTRINGVVLPPGSLIGTAYSQLPVDTQRCEKFKGAWFPVGRCDGFRFLRLTTLAVSPVNRVRAFSAHVAAQLADNTFFDPINTRIDDLASIARQQRPRLSSASDVRL